MDEKNKFTLTRGKLIALILLAIILVVFIILIIPKNSEKEYPVDSFEKLEAKMAEETKQYIIQNNIVLKESGERRITLKELIDSQSILETEITNLCTGYVIAKREGTISTKAYISCGKYYITEGYKKITAITSTTTTTNSIDNEKPIIKLNGLNIITIDINTKFTDPGVVAYDNVDGDITSDVTINGDVNISRAGSYILYYNVEDSSGNKAQVTRTIIVRSGVTTTTRRNTVKTTARTTTRNQVEPPTILLKGSKQVVLNQYDKYVEPGYTASDYAGNSLTSKVVVTGTVNTSVPGTYSKTYTVKDSYNNTTRVVRVITVIADTTVELKGISVQRNSIALLKGQKYQVVVYYNPSNATNKTVSWSSNNYSVATVSSTGLITAIGKGTAVIKTTSKDGNHTAYTSVVVSSENTTTTKTTTTTKITTTTKVTTKTIRLISISVLKKTITIAKGQQYQVVLYYNPSNATNKAVTWSSSNNSIATVSSTGVIKGVAKGTAVIKATSKDGNHTANTSVTVQ